MRHLVKDILIEIAEMLPAITQKGENSAEALPVHAPNFPHDLEPVIRAEPTYQVPSQRTDDRHESVAVPSKPQAVWRDMPPAVMIVPLPVTVDEGTVKAHASDGQHARRRVPCERLQRLRREAGLTA
ncbi:hypothetical protein [Mesorhizobium sp. M7A.F.Ca.ET.027.02.1.1]|uniref:hypothetical protein n=1 Tax=Mesorhizobium sp. M7A.F.Ca.ET.027.02.1.1 TaxID=2496655 RepID=UPI001679149D|nr:hypothetical protein [Mesorhizobium sp. M7A.F.Ca.ET.027.02.1.1]